MTLLDVCKQTSARKAADLYIQWELSISDIWLYNSSAHDRGMFSNFPDFARAVRAELATRIR